MAGKLRTADPRHRGAAHRRGCRGRCGRTPDDPEVFTAAVEALVDDPDCRRAMGAAGRSFVEGWASLEAVALAYEQLFDRLIAEGSRYPVGIRRP